MTAKLLIREVGQREFVSHNGNYEDAPANDGKVFPAEGEQVFVPAMTGEQLAAAEGERLCASGNVEAFQVWQLVTTKQRVWKLEEVES